MARLASDANMGYFPTNVSTIKKIIDKTLILPDENLVVVDSCCGKGEALEFICNEYNATGLAVELNEQRAQEASKKRFLKTLNASAIGGIKKSKYWAGINFLNPPYGLNEDKGRLEHDFVNSWGLTTAIGGVMILVINPSSLNEYLAKILRVQGYNPIGSFFDSKSDEYKNYKQMFIVLQKKAPHFRANINKIITVFRNPVDINSEFEFQKNEIKTGTAPDIFDEVVLPVWKINEYHKKSNLEDRFFKELHEAKQISRSIEHLNDGQSAIMIASGFLDKEVTLNDGKRVILKGTTSKTTKENLDLSGASEECLGIVKVSENYKTLLYGLNLTDGHFIKYQ